MCRSTSEDDTGTKSSTQKQGAEPMTTESDAAVNENPGDSDSKSNVRRRRGKRDKEGNSAVAKTVSQKKRKIKKKNQDEQHGGGIEAMLPSLAILVVLLFGFLAKKGFKGRSSVAGVDLGTTNSVVCVQQLSDGDGEVRIDCIKDPYNDSPIVPSVVNFIDAHERPVGASTKVPSLLLPHPTHVLVGAAAKERIDAHPHRTLYHAKRVLGRRAEDDAVKELRNEVEFEITSSGEGIDDDDDGDDNVLFRVPDYGGEGDRTTIAVSPQQVGSYVVNHLMKITREFLGHENVKSAVIAVPAKFTPLQRRRTVEAFQNAGVSVGRILEEPTAAALAYGLHQKDGVEHVLVYDFGGGTLDISMLHIAPNGGYCDVMGSDGDDRLGGADFDVAVAHLLEQRHSQSIQRNHKLIGETHMEAFGMSCAKITTDVPLCSRSSLHTLGEQLKIFLSRRLQERIDEGHGIDNDDLIVESSCLALPESANGQTEDDALCQSLQPVKLSLSLPEYNQAVQPLYDRATLPVTRLLEDLTLHPDEVDEIVMVGGTTRLPQIRQLVRQVFKTEKNPSPQLNAHIDPDLTVAYGAASVND